MTRITSFCHFRFVSITSLGLVLALLACDSTSASIPGSAAGAGPGAGGPSSGAGSPGSGAGASASSAGTGNATGGSTGSAGASMGSAGSGVGGAGADGTAGSPGSVGSAGGGTIVNLPPLVTSAPGAYWKTDGTLTDSTAAATVTVNDAMLLQKWDGFGAAFNELGWSVLTSSEMQTQALKLLFSASDGAAFLWGRIPMGASDYAISRYTNDDTGADPVPNGESNRPAADTALNNFTLARDNEKLVPYIKAAQTVKPDLRFWASPWTPPVWLKTGFKTDDGSSGTAKKRSFYDGGTVSNTPENLTAYAKYYTKFVQGYKDRGINIELVSPQNEPGYDQNYPSALWDAATYTAWVGKYLGPAMNAIGVKVMLGTLSNAGDHMRTDLDIANAVLADATAKSMVSVVGVQWGVLGKVVSGTTFSGLPIWATEHKCGNYPWCKKANDCEAVMGLYVSSQAPNDQAYGVESWGYLRDAISKGKVTSYSAWNMVLDKNGLGNDTSREWKQNALLVADSGKVNPTPAYYVFRHLSQYVTPGATVVGTTGGDAVAFKNPDGSLVAVVFNSGAANANYVVAFGAKKFQFAMPSNGWATVKYKP